MASTTDIRKGLKIQIDGVPFHIVDHQFVKPGKGQSFTRCRVRNLTNGNVVERTWKSGESVELADVEERKMAYSWSEGDNYIFMDTNTGDQIYLEKSKVGDEARFMAEGMDVEVTLFNGNPIGIEMPPNVVMQVVASEPGIKGDTASGATKPATLAVVFTVTAALLRVPGLTSSTKLVLAIVLQFWTVPVASHMLGRAARDAGLEPAQEWVTDETGDA